MKPLGAIMAVVGYARVSSVGQSLDVQLDKLKHCDKIFQEKRSGSSSKRLRLKACLEYIREGDTLVVTRLDRLARSTLHLCQLAKQLDRKQVNLQVLDQNIHTGDATGRLLFNMLGPLPNLRPKSGLNVESMASRMPKPVVSSWVGISI